MAAAEKVFRFPVLYAIFAAFHGPGDAAVPGQPSAPLPWRRQACIPARWQAFASSRPSCRPVLALGVLLSSPRCPPFRFFLPGAATPARGDAPFWKAREWRRRLK